MTARSRVNHSASRGMAMNRTRVGLGTVAAIAMLAIIGCSDSPTASIESPVARQANTLGASGVSSDGRLPDDSRLPAHVALNRAASAAVTQAVGFNTITVGGPSEGRNVFPFAGGYFLATR